MRGAQSPSAVKEALHQPQQTVHAPYAEFRLSQDAVPSGKKGRIRIPNFPASLATHAQSARAEFLYARCLLAAYPLGERKAYTLRPSDSRTRRRAHVQMRARAAHNARTRRRAHAQRRGNRCLLQVYC